jgi:hypothetical protein
VVGCDEDDAVVSLWWEYLLGTFWENECACHKTHQQELELKSDRMKSRAHVIGIWWGWNNDVVGMWWGWCGGVMWWELFLLGMFEWIV